ncbi:hypothetical protein, partial [Streptococcus equi]
MAAYFKTRIELRQIN